MRGAVDYPEAHLGTRGLDPQLMDEIGRDFCKRHGIVPLFREDTTLAIAFADVDDLPTKDALRLLFPRHTLEIFKASRSEIHEALGRIHGAGTTLEGVLQTLAHGPRGGGQGEEARSNPAVGFVDMLLSESTHKGASDIHCEPTQDGVRIRYRVDGVLKTQGVMTKSQWAPVINRLKILAQMDIAESRVPQNGRLTWYLGAHKIDFRLASHPTQYGESLVIRLLNQGHGGCALGELGFSAATLARIQRCLEVPDGLLVLTGPTGAGKTTSMYGVLGEFQSETRKIMTLEEPIEYTLPLVSQTEILDSGGMTFASGVKSLLRQDPDIILIGEIRDPETAHMALRASMTGHRVLTTLHTQGGVSGVYRLLELGVSPTFLAGHLAGIVAQRLIRQLCHSCKEPVLAAQPGPVSSSMFKVFQARGCEACHGVGYLGRLPIAEVVVFDDAMNGWLFRIWKNRLKC